MKNPALEKFRRISVMMDVDKMDLLNLLIPKNKQNEFVEDAIREALAQRKKPHSNS